MNNNEQPQKNEFKIDDDVDSMLNVLKKDAPSKKSIGKSENTSRIPVSQADSATPAPEKTNAGQNLDKPKKVSKPQQKNVSKIVDFDDIDPDSANMQKQKRLENKKNEHAKGFSAKKKNSAAIFGYIVFVLAVSVIFSVTFINFANDIYAFVKEDTEVTVTIPENAKLSQVAHILHENKIINHPVVFKSYARKKFRNNQYLSGKFRAGKYDLNPMMNYDTIISTISMYTNKAHEEVRITIPEGLTLIETIDLLCKNGIGEKEKYLDVVENYDYDYKFLKMLEENGISDDRTYRLEGYLFPDTYDFFTDESEVSVIDKFLKNFDNKFEEAYYERCEQLKITVDQAVIIASIIEKEAKYTKDLSGISSVIHNRLFRSSYYSSVLDPGSSVLTLDSNATVQYALAERKEHLSKEDLNIDSPYNTHTHSGFTPGPIANPGIETIHAALYPDSTNYYFFFSTSDGNTVFSRTASEHNSAIAKAEAEGKFK